MKQPIVIAATYDAAEYLCREILEINPAEHAMSAHQAAREGLIGYYKPVVIMYCENYPIGWIVEDLTSVRDNLKDRGAVVINIPEVNRVSRPAR